MSLPKLCIRIDFIDSASDETLKTLKSILSTLNQDKPNYISTNLSFSKLTDSTQCDELYELCTEENISWIPIINSIREVDLTRPYYSKLPNGKIGYMLGIPANSIKDIKLLEYSRDCADYIVLYTGLSTQKEIDRAIEIAQPDLVIHHSIGEIKLDYLRYLQHISMEFSKKYQVGFKNTEGSSPALLLASSILGADFIEYVIEFNKKDLEYYLESPGKFNEYRNLVTDLTLIDSSRGGYEARKLTKIEKEFRNNENNSY